MEQTFPFAMVVLHRYGMAIYVTEDGFIGYTYVPDDTAIPVGYNPMLEYKDMQSIDGLPAEIAAELRRSVEVMYV